MEKTAPAERSRPREDGRVRDWGPTDERTARPARLCPVAVGMYENGYARTEGSLPSELNPTIHLIARRLGQEALICGAMRLT